MQAGLIGPGPYRATKLWNEIVKLFVAGMPIRKHRIHFRSYDSCFCAFEAVDWMHELLKGNINFGPEVNRSQTVQLLKKFLKNHVIEDIKGGWGTEDFEDNNSLYRFPPSSPLKPYPRRRQYSTCRPVFPDWRDLDQGTNENHFLIQNNLLDSDTWWKRHSIAIGEVPECRLVRRRELSESTIEQIWKSMTLSHLQKILGLDSLNEVFDTKHANAAHIFYNVQKVNKHGVVVLENKSEELPHWVLSAMKCLANWPNGTEVKQSVYTGFERDVFRTIADYFKSMKEPLLTFRLYELFVNILGVLPKQQVAIEALQICCLLLPPENRRKLQLLMRMMARIGLNPEMPLLSDTSENRMLMVHTFSRCILCSEEEVDLDEILATRLVMFMMDNYQEILKIPVQLKNAVEEHLAHLQRVQIKYAGADADVLLPSHSFCHQIITEEFQEQQTDSSEAAATGLLEKIIADQQSSVKEKKKKLKQFQKSYPDIYKKRFPTPESEAVLFPEKPKFRQQLMFFALKKPFQPFQRTRSFRM
ncbi:DEP domain-containing protein 1B [Protopterus annectens]|uniref:DEP domain-containing protein 1B n=1 Tax=Protopterus annectens TaxID=7888 RepID=UPI001CFBC9E8|nr:DEP domain-containing protein 1B [Protopterus annectens]